MADLSPASVSAPCEFLEWDSSFFGFRIGRVVVNRLISGQLPEILSWCGRHSIDCLYFLSDPEKLSTSLAEEHGFHLTDVRLTLEVRLGAELSGPNRQECIRPATAGDIPLLRTIAAKSHQDSRFYQDGHFPHVLCDELYRAWIEKSCAGGSDLVLVAEHTGKAAGYITCELGGGHGKIGLLAVASEAQGLGLGHALVVNALNWMHAQGVAAASVVTQGRNTGAQRLYQAHGFAAASLQLWYHLWLSKHHL